MALLLAGSSIAQEEGLKTSYSPITRITLKSPVTPPAPAQGKDRLLWYVGKKVDDSTLMTTHGTLVRWSKRRNMVIVQAKKDPFASVINALGKNEKIKAQFYDLLAEKKNALTYYQDLVSVNSELEAIQTTFTDCLKNTVTLPAPLSSTAFKSTWKKGGVASIYSVQSPASLAIPAYIRKAYDALMLSMKNYPSIDFPPPPDMEFGVCHAFDCDSSAYKKLMGQLDQWQQGFSSYERGIINQSHAIIQSLQLLPGGDNDPEASVIYDGLNKAAEFAKARMKNKTELLVRKYGSDFKKLPAITFVVISEERQRQLLGSEDVLSETYLKLPALFNGFEEFMDDQMDKRNYDLVLNPAFFIGIERQRQLLGAADDNRIPEIMEKLQAFNRFRIELQIDYEGEKEVCDYRIKFTATNLNPVYISFRRQECKFSLFAYEDPNPELPIAWYNFYRGVFEMPLTITNGSATEIIHNWDGTCNSKPHDLDGLNLSFSAPLSSFSFCEGTEDSVQFGNSIGKNERKKDKRYDFIRFLEMPEEASLPENIEQMEMELDDLHKKIREKETQRFTKPTLEELEQQYADELRRKRLAQQVWEYEERADPGTMVFDAVNGSEIIIDEKTTRTKKIDQEDAYEKSTMTIRVKIIHDPLPYKVKKK